MVIILYIFILKNQQYIRGEISSIAFSSGSDYIATVDKTKAIWVWDIKNKSNPEKPVNFNKGMKFHNEQISSMQFSPDGKRLVTCANDSNIYLWMCPLDGKSDNIHLDHAFTERKATSLGWTVARYFDFLDCYFFSLISYFFKFVI